MTTASRSLATALRKARFASGLLPPSYTTPGDTIAIDVMRFRDDVDGRTYLSKVAWRNGDEFGLMFLGK